MSVATDERNFYLVDGDFYMVNFPHIFQGYFPGTEAVAFIPFSAKLPWQMWIMYHR